METNETAIDNDDDVCDINFTNMTSQVNVNHSTFLVERFRPKRYKKTEDIEEFIKECQRYFKLTKVKGEMQEAIVIGCLDDEAITIYEKETSTTEGYAERLRKAFKRKTSIVEDKMKALTYKKMEESSEDYFEKV